MSRASEAVAQQTAPASRNNSVGAETRKLTVADLLALVTGFAVAFAMPSIFNLGGLALVVRAIPVWLVVVVTALTFILWLDIATSFVVFVRRFRYRTMPRPGDWLAIVLSLAAVNETLPNVDTAVNAIYRIVGDADGFGIWRWRIGAAGAVIVLVGILLLRLGRRRISAGTQTLAISVLTLILMWGPFSIFAKQFPYLLPPLTGLGDGWLLWLTAATQRGLGRWPFALLFIVPTIATYFAWRKGGRRNWVWTEWIGAGTAFLLGMAWFAEYYFGSYERPPTGWISERIVTTIGLLASFLLFAPLVRRWGERDDIRQSRADV